MGEREHIGAGFFRGVFDIAVHRGVGDLIAAGFERRRFLIGRGRLDLFDRCGMGDRRHRADQTKRDDQCGGENGALSADSVHWGIPSFVF